MLLLDAERNLRAAFRLTADTFGLEDERSATAFSNLLRCYLAMGIAREGETEELINSPEVSPPLPPLLPFPSVVSALSSIQSFISNNTLLRCNVAGPLIQENLFVKLFTGIFHHFSS